MRLGDVSGGSRLLRACCTGGSAGGTACEGGVGGLRGCAGAGLRGRSSVRGLDYGRRAALGARVYDDVAEHRDGLHRRVVFPHRPPQRPAGLGPQNVARGQFAALLHDFCVQCFRPRPHGADSDRARGATHPLVGCDWYIRDVWGCAILSDSVRLHADSFDEPPQNYNVEFLVLCCRCLWILYAEA